MFVISCRLLDNDSSSTRDKRSENKAAPSENITDIAPDKNGLCDNAYYPTGEKIERKYRIVYQGSAIMSPKEYAQTYSNISADKFTEHNKFDDGQNALIFHCTADGLQGLQFGNGSNTLSIADNARGKLETIKYEGLNFPAESRWRVGEKWAGKGTARSKMQMGDNASSEMDVETEAKSEIVGEESVTVAAGTFQAFKVQTKTVYRHTSVKVNGASVPMNPTLTLNATAWHAKNVGMVKSIMTGAVGSATTELLSINNP